MIGARSEPHAEEIKVGSVFHADDGESVSVYGHGDLGGDPWGRINFRWGRGEEITFTKGGVISWAPEGESNFTAQGNTDVPLVAILLEADVSDTQDPITMTIKEVWHIPQGAFTLNTK